MGTKLGLLFPLLLPLILSGCAYSEARRLEKSELGDELEELELGLNGASCVLCEHFARRAAEYVRENKTQAEVIEIFHRFCFRLPSFQQQCTLMVDYYAPLFFLEVSSMRPREFCMKMNFCKHAPSPPPAATEESPPPSMVGDSLSGEHICEVCHNTIFRLLTRLKDPGTELRIVERLVKGCVVTDHFADKCQSLIFQYGPVILVNAVRLLEHADLCVTLQACPGNKNETIVAFSPSPAPVFPLFEDM